MKLEPQKRVCIYPKDVQKITGKSYRFSRELIAKIKNHLNRDKNQFVSIEEFCDYTGLSLETVLPLIQG
jgi:hypothetical protein